MMSNHSVCPDAPAASAGSESPQVVNSISLANSSKRVASDVRGADDCAQSPEGPAVNDPNPSLSATAVLSSSSLPLENNNVNSLNNTNNTNNDDSNNDDNNNSRSNSASNGAGSHEGATPQHRPVLYGAPAGRGGTHGNSALPPPGARKDFLFRSPASSAFPTTTTTSTAGVEDGEVPSTAAATSMERRPKKRPPSLFAAPPQPPARAGDSQMGFGGTVSTTPVLTSLAHGGGAAMAAGTGQPTSSFTKGGRPPSGNGGAACQRSFANPESPSGPFSASMCSVGSAASAGALHYGSGGGGSIQSPKLKPQFSIRKLGDRAATAGGTDSPAMGCSPSASHVPVWSTPVQPTFGNRTASSTAGNTPSSGVAPARQRRQAPAFTMRAAAPPVTSPVSDAARVTSGSFAPASAAAAASSNKHDDRRYKKGKGPLVRLSRDKRTLVASLFRVSSEGCLTVRNFLLLNPTRIDMPAAGGQQLLRSPDSNSSLLKPCPPSTPHAAGLALGEHEADDIPTPLMGVGCSGVGAATMCGGGFLTAPGGQQQQQQHHNANGHTPLSSSFMLHSASMDTPYSPITYSMDSTAFPSGCLGVAKSQMLPSPDSSSSGRLLRAGRERRNDASPNVSRQPAGFRCSDGAASCGAALNTSQRIMGGENILLHTSSRPSAPPGLSNSSHNNTLLGASPVFPGGVNGAFHADPTASSLLLPYADIPRKYIHADGRAPRLPSNAVLWKDLDFKSSVGHGASASVFVAIHQPTGRRLAVKRMDLTPLCLATAQDTNNSNSAAANYLYFSTGNGRAKQLEHIVIRELQVLHLTYRSPFMVKVYNAFFSVENMALDIVMEFMHYGSLDHVAQCLQNHTREQQYRRRVLNDSMSTAGAVSLTSPSAAVNPSSSPADRTSAAASRMGSPLYESPDFPYYANLEAMRATATLSAATASTTINASVCSNAGTDEMEDENGCPEELFGVAERIVAVVGEQLLRGVRDMHERGFIHRDIKPGNVLINEHGVVKLSDFGLSQRCDETGAGVESVHKTFKAPPSAAPTRTNTPLHSPKPLLLGEFHSEATTPILPSVFLNDEVAAAALPKSANDAAAAAGMDVLDAVSTSSSDGGSTNGGGLGRRTHSHGSSDSEDDVPCSGTNKYMSPERQRGEPHGKPSDVWALGVTLAEFAVGTYPYDLDNCVDEFERGSRLERPVDVSAFSTHRAVPLSPILQDFLRLATLPVASQRPTAKELLEHPFFRQWNRPFNLKEYLSLRIPVPSNVYKEEYLRRKREAALEATT